MRIDSVSSIRRAKRMVELAVMDLWEADDIVERLDVGDDLPAQRTNQRLHDAVEHSIAIIQGSFALIERLR